MNKNFLIAIGVIVLIGGVIYFNQKNSLPKQISQFKSTEKKIAQDLGLKEGRPNVPSYPRSRVDIDKCGKDAFYIEEKSADFVKNYCRFLRDKGWQFVHPDYPTCEDIRSFGGGYNYQKGREKIAVSVIRYGEDAACFWVFNRK